jgi:hypothetical protein
MLDEEEFRRVIALFGKGPGESVRDKTFGAILIEFERITGVACTNPNVCYHHRISIYGAPCQHCGKPLRTPRAKLCGSCMKPVQRPQAG